MRMRSKPGVGVAAALVVWLALTAGPAAGASPEVVRTDADVEVVNPADGETYTLDGYRVSPAGCEPRVAVLLLHGLSYTGEAWDVPGYSYARILGAAGYDVYALDRLGYGDSALDDGRDVTIFGQADMAAQVVRQLAERYDDVVLAGHSAGAETSISAVALAGAPVSALVPMGYHTYPGVEFLALDWSMDQLSAVTDDYVYFMGTPERRAEMFYTAANADAEVIAADTAAAVLTPSGELQTITFQPGRIGSALVDVPVLLQLAEDDQLFPVDFAPFWAAQFVSAPSVTTDVVPGSAHTYMLHHAGPAAADRIVDWLGSTAGLPGCEAPAAGDPGTDPGPVAAPTEPTTADDREGTLPSTGGGAGLAALTAVTTLAGALGLRRRGTD